MLSHGCATVRTVVPCKPVIACQHPVIDPSTSAGMARGILDYQEALDQCNALNAAEAVDEAELSAFEKVRQSVLEFEAPDLSTLKSKLNPFKEETPSPL